ncbi:DHA1 family chloramphenicol resistance protein-like MFS transporter [Prauserella sediminis]|uniref:DHA1 family chloramphenicol resistance protein-like MFS transporter n=1 Tax=Prauserella sediminis TaxID=577680 RepID=A0A839XRY2_9PSEU|nr:Cmx/CmrA family chloramphenicol efflux MFS transporter [Prauserella sediminis]MBB3662736.1 DHA1 family chloramphenicol resistance protein-like MFS transporter [Prauserella sediminis]
MAAKRSGMPLAIWGIGFGIFAQGTSELMLAGLLPEMAADLDVTIPTAGWLISAFALGMLVGAPTLAVLTLRWPRRSALLVFLAAFVLSHVVSALTDSYGLLLAMRFVGAFAYAGFWAVGGSTAMALVGPDRRGRAMSIVAGGLTVATVVGLPAGTWIGQHLGWRGAFWAVAVLSSVGAAAIIAAVPPLRPENPPSLRNELRGLRPPRLWLSYAMTAVATTALLGTFSYLAAMLIETTGLDSTWVPAVLFGYGFGALIGIAIGGKTADRHPRAVLGIGFTGLLMTSLLLALTAHHVGTTVVLVVALGVLGFGTNPALNSRFMTIAPDAPTLAVSGNVAAFNVGITLGPWIGGLVLAAGHAYPAVPAVGAAVAGLALLLWAWDLTLQARAGRPKRTVGQEPSVAR